MFKKLLIIIIPFLLFSCSSRVDEAEVKKARQFFESVFQDNVLESPEFQASLGYKSNYDKWDDITWQASRQRAYRAKDDLAYLEKNIDFDKLDEGSKISYRLMVKRLQRTIDNDFWAPVISYSHNVNDGNPNGPLILGDMVFQGKADHVTKSGRSYRGRGRNA